MGCMFYEQEKNCNSLNLRLKINQTLIKNKVFAKLNKSANNKQFPQITSSQAVWRGGKGG